MQQQQCPNCSAPMILCNNRNGTTAYRCEYCGNVIDNIPHTTTDKIFTFVNRAINAVNESRGVAWDEKAANAREYADIIKQKAEEAARSLDQKEDARRRRREEVERKRQEAIARAKRSKW